LPILPTEKKEEKKEKNEVNFEGKNFLLSFLHLVFKPSENKGKVWRKAPN